MNQTGNIFIVGTSHIAAQSVHEIRQAFSEINPEIIAVELDKGRLHGLLSGEKPSYHPRIIRQIGAFGYLFAVIGGLIQKKLGNLVGMTPGSEMKAAALLAHDNGRKLALIDQDVRITLKRLSQEFTFRQKMRLVGDILASPFSKQMRIDLKRVPEKKVIAILLKMLKDRYPGLYKPLIEERNEYMARRLLAISAAYPSARILAVIGAGHEEGIMALLKAGTAQN